MKVGICCKGQHWHPLYIRINISAADLPLRGATRRPPGTRKEEGSPENFQRAAACNSSSETSATLSERLSIRRTRGVAYSLPYSTTLPWGAASLPYTPRHYWQCAPDGSLPPRQQVDLSPVHSRDWCGHHKQDHQVLRWAVTPFPSNTQAPYTTLLETAPLQKPHGPDTTVMWSNHSAVPSCATPPLQYQSAADAPWSSSSDYLVGEADLGDTEVAASREWRVKWGRWGERNLQVRICHHEIWP